MLLRLIPGRTARLVFYTLAYVLASQPRQGPGSNHVQRWRRWQPAPKGVVDESCIVDAVHVDAVEAHAHRRASRCAEHGCECNIFANTLAANKEPPLPRAITRI